SLYGREHLRAVAPTLPGPRPAPAGPLPPGWSGPQPNPSYEITGSVPPAPSAPRPIPAVPDPAPRFLVPSGGLLGLVLVVVLVVLAQRRVRGGVGGTGTEVEAGWNR